MSGIQRSSSSAQTKRTELGTTIRTGQSSRKAQQDAMAWIVLPNPMSSPIKARPPRRTAKATPARWNGINAASSAGGSGLGLSMGPGFASGASPLSSSSSPTLAPTARAALPPPAPPGPDFRRLDASTPGAACCGEADLRRDFAGVVSAWPGGGLCSASAAPAPAAGGAACFAAGAFGGARLTRREARRNRSASASAVSASRSAITRRGSPSRSRCPMALTP
mmetsp:Transcript_2527/g.9765  ORF Transcript_2527/g.9765 Transcript_2527/m.9765 type:complete len:222 (-) Transcript_2527:359-1024(-)